MDNPMAMGPLLIGLYVFILAMFVGFEVITKVPPTLHTPLMSGANAISGISVVGALLGANVAFEKGDCFVSIFCSYHYSLKSNGSLQ